MKKYSTISLSGVYITFLTALFLIIQPNILHSQQGVINTDIPDGGFAVDGNLLAKSPTTVPFSADNGDFLPNDNAPGTGGNVFTSAGLPLDTSMAFHIVDGFNSGDADIFTQGSKFNDDPNTWVWKEGKAPGKDDINHVMFFFSTDSLGNIWFVGSGDRLKVNGNTYLDFELLQQPLYQNTDYTFTSMGIHGGRPLGDLAITVIYTIGGTNPQLEVYQWSETSPGSFGYEVITPDSGTYYLAVNSDSAVVVPYGAFGEYTYQESAFTEVAVNINELVPGNNACLDIKTVIAKTKASQSYNAVLKDFAKPVQVDISSNPEISVNDATVCQGDTAELTASVISGIGPFSYNWSTGDTTATIYVAPDTTTTYWVVVTGVNGCPSDTAYATVTVFPLPDCFIAGPDTICPFGLEQFTGSDTMSLYAWTVSGPAMIVGDTSGQMVEVQGLVSCDTSFILELYVIDTNGCANSCSITVAMIDTMPPVITDVPDSLFVDCIGDVPVASIDSVTVTDNCIGNIYVTVSDSIYNDTLCTNQLSIIRTWTAEDSCGNYAMATQFINVFDSIPPVLYDVPADTGYCCPDSVPPPADVTAFDNCDLQVIVAFTEIVYDSTGPNMFFINRTWTAEDTCQNFASATQIIEVNDSLYPGGGNVSIPSADDITLYFNALPNPFKTNLEIELSLLRSSEITIDLYNFTGIKLQTVFRGNVKAGEPISTQITPDAGMKPGMYMIVLRTQYGLITKRVIMMK